MLTNIFNRFYGRLIVTTVIMLSIPEKIIKNFIKGRTLDVIINNNAFISIVHNQFLLVHKFLKMP